LGTPIETKEGTGFFERVQRWSDGEGCQLASRESRVDEYFVGRTRERRGKFGVSLVEWEER
jgi:hypothetical protein